MQKDVPQIIKEVGFDFSWSEEKVWQLDLPTEDMSIEDLKWHFDIPFWNSQNGFYDLKPIDVINHPDQYQREYQRTLIADLRYPLDIMFWKNRWLLLDGLHRLVKAVIEGQPTIKVRKVPKELITAISK